MPEREYCIIIPSRNVTNLKACHAAIAKHQPGARVLTIWDGDEKLEWSAGFLGLSFRGAKPFIFARNCNHGAATVPEHDVILLNDDALLETAGGFDLLADAAHAHKEYGIIAPTVRGLTCCLEQKPGIVWRTPGPLHAIRNHMVPFICVYLRREVLAEVGPLDEDSLTDANGVAIYTGEDDLYCWRVRQAGYGIAVLDTVVVEHGSLPSTFRTHADGSRRILPLEPCRELFKQKTGVDPRGLPRV